MKKIIAMLLVMVLSLSVLGGCAKGETAGETTDTGAFSVGYGKADISPEKSVYLIGHNDPVEERMSTGVAEKIYATAVAFTDAEGETVIFIACDLLYIKRPQCNPIRQQISEETGVPFDHILIHNSHSHSSPDAADLTYNRLLSAGLVAAAKTAMADRAPAQMHTAFSHPEGYVYVRHYLMNDGTYRAEGVGAVKNDTIGHTHKCDNLMQLVKFTREGKKDILLMSWRGHPWGNEPVSYTTASSNYPGVMRYTVEAELDCLGVFILAASGNSNNGTQIEDEDRFGKNYVDLGKALGAEVVKTAENFTPAATDKIYLEENVYLGDSVYGSNFEVPLYAFSIGDVAFVTAPFEVFDTSEVYVRKSSKFPMTIYASVTNDWQSYLPTPESFSWEHRYEVRVTQYPQGMAEIVAEELAGMLGRLFTEAGYQETEKAPGYHTPEFVPVSDGVEYTNPFPGDLTAYEEVANGFIRVKLLKGTTLKLMLAIDQATAEKVLAQSTMKLVFDEQNVIVDVVS